MLVTPCSVDCIVETSFPLFDCFKPVSAEDIEKVIMSSSNKSCMLDTLPMWLCKDNASIMSNVLKDLVYMSFCNGEYYSKIMEKIAAAQLQDHLCTQDLHGEFQSAYRAQHSTETALLRVKTDIMTEMDNGKAVLVVLLDLSAAFDTVDHQILLDRLSSTFNITGMALKWISSYLSGRYFRVSVGGDLSVSNAADGSNDSTSTSSDKFGLEFGVPQRSVLGPLFFVLYLCSIGDIIRKHKVLTFTYMLMIFGFTWRLILK